MPLAGHGSLLLVFRGLSKRQTAGQYSVESCGHKEDPVGPQIKPMAFNSVCTPFYTIISLQAIAIRKYLVHS